MKTSKLVQIFPLVIIFGASSFLLFYRLSELMPFIGDQAWFYISARDLILNYQIPLVGITSSHTWLHQGPLWTYILALLLPFANFNPVVPAYFTAFFTVITGILIFLVTSKLYSRGPGLIAAVFFSFSPLVIMLARMPYHTSLIPLFTLLLMYCTLIWTEGKTRYFPYIFLFLGILYNLELAAVVLWSIPLALFIFGYRRKTIWYKQIINIKSFSTSLLLGCIPMIPIFIYDLTHGFPQTIVFASWMLAKALHIFLPFIPLATPNHSFSEMLAFLFENNSLLVLGGNKPIAFLITALGIFFFIKLLLKKKNNLLLVTLLFFILPLLGLIVSKTPSTAYLPMLFPSLFIVLGVGYAELAKTNLQKIFLIFIISALSIINAFWLLSNDYFIGKPNSSGVGISTRIKAAKAIVHEANGMDYTFVQKGEGSQFENIRLNTDYLTFLLGNTPKKGRQNLTFTIYETPESLTLYKNNSILKIW